ncbi:MAG: amidohydrolase family protein, partial [Peptidiphaga sp.]
MSTNDASNHPRAAAPPDQSAPPAVSAPAPAEGGAASSDAPGQRPGRPIARVGVLLDGVRWVAPATDGGERLNGREKAILSADRVLTGGRQGRELDVLDAGGLYIEGTRIAAVGRAADLLAAHPHARHVNFPGATLMPGLIETHAHLATSGTDVEYPDYGPDEVARLTLNAAASARELLSIGVTSVQSLGARHYVDVALRDAIEAGALRGPRVLASGPQITTTAGHSWQAGAEVDGLDGIRREVRAHHRRGVDVVKVMATGGFTTDGSAPWFAQFSQDELAVLFAEAHRLGKRTAAHAHGTEGIERAVAAGVDYIAHAS